MELKQNEIEAIIHRHKDCTCNPKAKKGESQLYDEDCVYVIAETTAEKERWKFIEMLEVEQKIHKNTDNGEVNTFLLAFLHRLKAVVSSEVS